MQKSLIDQKHAQRHCSNGTASVPFANGFVCLELIVTGLSLFD